jgi:hypothetical protein
MPFIHFSSELPHTRAVASYMVRLSSSHILASFNHGLAIWSVCDLFLLGVEVQPMVNDAGVKTPVND